MLLGLSLFAFACTTSAQSPFQEGTHFDVLDKEKSEKPMVKEFFSLFCGHCFQFEPFIDSLQHTLPKEVTFTRSHVDYIPRDNKAVSFGIVKAYNVMLDLNKEEELRRAFFVAIHLGQDPIDTEAKIKQIFLDQGVEEATFDELYSSQSVIDRSQAMADLWMEYEISSVPTVVVNEKYKIRMDALKSMQELIDLTNYLLKQK